jgi:hypothetical protein
MQSSKQAKDMILYYNSRFFDHLRIGEGSYGVVYKAFDKELNRVF